MQKTIQRMVCLARTPVKIQDKPQKDFTTNLSCDGHWELALTSIYYDLSNEHLRKMASIRHRSASKVKTGTKSSNVDIDGKTGGTRILCPTSALWAAAAVAFLLLITSFAGTDSQANSENVALRPQWNSKKKSLLQPITGVGHGKKKTPCPDEYKWKFWMEHDKINQPVARALRMQGWEKTDDFQHAHVIWTYTSTTKWYDKLEPWQRYNHLPKYKLFNNKDTFVTYMMAYAEKIGQALPAIPETYRLDVASDLEKFRHRLFKDGGLNIPWVLKKPRVNQGKGITMLGPNTRELKSVLKTVEAEKDVQNYIIQRYVCNEMTIDNRKFDFRVFWFVVSLDPLIVMYHDGYLRIGNSEYSEQDFSNTKAHLTTHTFLATEGKATWDEFGEYLVDAVKNNENLKHIKDPALHVKNQVKHVLAEMAAAFKEATFNADLMSAENGFAFYGADFIIDWDLDIFFIEPQHGCGLDEDHQFRVEMHNSMFSSMITAAEEIWERQERGLSTECDSIKNMGALECVYNDKWMFEYEGYVRSKDKKGCEIAQRKA